MTNESARGLETRGPIDASTDYYDAERRLRGEPPTVGGVEA